MAKTYTDFSQLSKGVFKKSEPVVEVKPQPEAGDGQRGTGNGDDVLSYFGLVGNGKRNRPLRGFATCGEANTPSGASAEGTARAGAVGVPGASCARADNGRIQSLEANVAALRAESAALGAAKAEAERKSADLEQQLAAGRLMRASAEAERDRLRGEVLRLKNELEEVLTAPGTQPVVSEPVRETQVAGLLKPPATAEVFPGEVREHILAVLSEGLEAAQSSERERRAAVLEDVLAANKPGSELERRRKELKQIIKDTGSFVDARTIAALEKIGFKCVSGNKHWKLDYANVRIPISKTPSDRRGAQNTATDIANRCF